MKMSTSSDNNWIVEKFDRHRAPLSDEEKATIAETAAAEEGKRTFRSLPRHEFQNMIVWGLVPDVSNEEEQQHVAAAVGISSSKTVGERASMIKMILRVHEKLQKLQI
ncbi:hypothetical protein BBJ29_005586 [Phytophthora kernoviae]|uniref:Uncharacterized protein n=1 Tax=Phytophthora kernoviae TaxID=325452 RepID=A0A3F2RK43_9STRA|nr:hypothetical protein BBP00_00006769 [Phytophthora kernoviae]RLN67771.1 hypothetical protein BBJ29_005586 [Phytophthora kernoviae]